MYMRLLELLCGTSSDGSDFASAGWEVVSLNSDPKTDATLHEDISIWDYHLPTHLEIPTQFGPALLEPIAPVPDVVLKQRNLV